MNNLSVLPQRKGFVFLKASLFNQQLAYNYSVLRGEYPSFLIEVQQTFSGFCMLIHTPCTPCSCSFPSTPHVEIVSSPHRRSTKIIFYVWRKTIQLASFKASKHSKTYAISIKHKHFFKTYHVEPFWKLDNNDILKQVWGVLRGGRAASHVAQGISRVSPPILFSALDKFNYAAALPLQ